MTETCRGTSGHEALEAVGARTAHPADCPCAARDGPCTPDGPARGDGRPVVGPSPEDAPADWVAALSASGPEQAAALAQLHALMIRAARHQVWRMRSQLGDVGPTTLDVIVNQSADEAMAVLLRKLHTFEGRSRFTTWAYKFAVLQAAAEVRRTAWRSRDVELHDVDTIRDPAASPSQEAEATDLARALVDAMTSVLTLHQRRVTIALVVDLVPVDVLAERLGTTRGALYKTLHDARTRLRADLVRTGYLPVPDPAPEPARDQRPDQAAGQMPGQTPDQTPTAVLDSVTGHGPDSVPGHPDQEVTP